MVTLMMMMIAQEDEAPPEEEVEEEEEEIVEMFRQAYLMRRLEIAADTLFEDIEPRGVCHLYALMQAVVTNVCIHRRRRGGDVVQRPLHA